MKKFDIALIGNPNVGKSTIFNALTNLHQHTGNWSGKTVMMAQGSFKIDEYIFNVIDLPGTYSLNAKSKDEEIACECILKSKLDALIIILDESRIGRNLLLALQIMRHKKNIILVLNFADEAKQNNIILNKGLMKKILNVPIVETSARNNTGINILRYEIYKTCQKDYDANKKLNLPEQTDKLLEIADTIEKRCVKKIFADKSNIMLDNILTSKFFALPIMFLMLLIVFWITIFGANYFSDLLTFLFSKLEIILRKIFDFCNASDFLSGIFIDGMYRTLVWVISVMLPPMAIFFPLFTLLEDFGLLPRIAFNLDGIFKKFGSNGKQSLTMCMGFGCNAAGVVSCRIIDSKRDKLIAILTNNFVPCNGRFPGLIILASMLVCGKFVSLKIALIISLAIISCVIMTLLVSKILSVTIFKGRPSFFILELAPYRKPKFFHTIIRSIFDKTLFVLWRAVIVAIPAGIFIWLFANLNIHQVSIFNIITKFLDPFGKIMGLDGTILAAFLLGMPANEIVFPLIIMSYTNNLSLIPIENFNNINQILKINGWNATTIICTIIFYLYHFPCSTTLLTIKKETDSLKLTLLAFILPTLIGIILCIGFNFLKTSNFFL